MTCAAAALRRRSGALARHKTGRQSSFLSRVFHTLAIAGIGLLLTACWQGDESDSGIDPLIRDVIIESDNLRIADPGAVTHLRATVFLPEDNPDGPYPLVIHSHYWGGSRVSADNVRHLPAFKIGTPYALLMDAVVPALRKAGYAVISYDQRGFGRNDDNDDGTEDGSHGMSPNFEIQDAKAVIDWAVANLNPMLDGPGDPRLGMVGGSYGGAFQLMSAAEDERVDAIVPAVTWFDLYEALVPNNVLKKGWLQIICGSSLISSQVQLSPEIEQACAQLVNPNTRELADAPATRLLFLENGLAHYGRRPTFNMPNVDALIIHGSRDGIFNLNQADSMLNFLSRGGGDVKLLAHETGHPSSRYGAALPPPMGEPYCGNLDTVALTVQWLDEKLRGADNTRLPRVCLSLDERHAVHLNSLPRGNHDHRVNIPLSTVSGRVHNNDYSAADEALFVPLASPIADSGYVLAGIPVARLSIQAGSGNIDPTPWSGPNAAGLFVGVGIERDGEVQLVDGQVVPVLSTDVRVGLLPAAIELAGVGEKLEVGDRVGLLLYGKHDEYENHTGRDATQGSNWRNNVAVVSGSVDLPIFRAQAIDQRI